MYDHKAASVSSVWSTGAGHKVPRRVVCIRPGVDMTTSNLRRKECKARGTSYYTASGYSELRTALSTSDTACLHGKPRNMHGCKWCTAYHMDSRRWRDWCQRCDHLHLVCCNFCIIAYTRGHIRGQRRRSHCMDNLLQVAVHGNEPSQCAGSLA